jgi:membrane-anchored protein YejM (alkaline phosphatase superfamily)
LSSSVLDPSGAPRAALPQRFPALVWALLHAPLLLALYAPAVASAIAAAPPRFRVALLPAFLVQALALAALPWLVTVPLSRWPRAYRFAAPGAVGLFTAAIAIDSQVHRAVGFHLNGFFFRVLLEPTGLGEVGLSLPVVAALAAGALAAVALDALAGARFIRRRPSPRRTAALAAGLLALAGAERVYGQVLTHFGGPAMFAASGVLPLQAPVRMSGLLNRTFGKRSQDPFADADAHRLPPGVDPAQVRFARKPDVLFVVAESLPHDHLDARTLPNVWRRAGDGARFTRHYASASATHFSVFSLFYGLHAQKLEATVGAGRRPVIFSAFRENGYGVHALAASCVDWMGLKETVFAGLSGALETWCDAPGLGRDVAMLERARTIVRQTRPDEPLFLFLFFNGTHFGYPYDPRDRAFEPEWDGAGGLKATRVDGTLIKNRARNAARTVDRLLEAFLVELEATRGTRPLVVFTGDHGEEFRQKGHIGHGSAVTDEQVHVPFVVHGPGIPRGVFEAPTSHVDLVPTLFAALGDTHEPALHSDGMDAFRATPDRFVLATVGWEPRYAAIGTNLKVGMYAGLGSMHVTDPDDQPLPDGSARLAEEAGAILRAMRGGGAAAAIGR